MTIMRAIVGTALVLAMSGTVLIAEGDREAQLRVSRADCLALVEHQAADDVTYAPGRDVHGRPVAPAELGSGAYPIEPPEYLIFNVEVDLVDLLGGSGVTRHLAEPVIGIVTFKGNRAYFNGTPLYDLAQAKLADHCRQALAGQQ